jgi:hypothetical protein
MLIFRRKYILKESSNPWQQPSKKVLWFFTNDEEDALGGGRLEHGRVTGHLAAVLPGRLERHVVEHDLSLRRQPRLRGKKQQGPML